MKLINDFYNKLVQDIHNEYFPTIKYLKDDKRGANACYAIECFSNGVIPYATLIKRLATNCKTTPDKLHVKVNMYVTDFEGYEFEQ